MVVGHDIHASVKPKEVKKVIDKYQ
jgi:hypothetical protein